MSESEIVIDGIYRGTYGGKVSERKVLKIQPLGPDLYVFFERQTPRKSQSNEYLKLFAEWAKERIA